MAELAKVLFIGLDAAERDLILAWANSGLLPNLRALRQRSLWCDAPALHALGSGALWPSFASGVTPSQHGRFFGFQMEPGTYDTVKIRQPNGQWRPFWEILSRAGRRVAVINVPDVPLCEDLNGLQVTDWAVHNPVSGVHTWPPDLGEEIIANFGADPVGRCDHYNHNTTELSQLTDRLVQRVKSKGELACRYLEQGGWDLFLTMFDESHCVGHQCWHLHDSEHPLHDPEMAQAIGDPLRRIYVEIDQAIGRLLERVGPDTTTILFSGTGMGPNYSGNHILDDILVRLDKTGPDIGRMIVKTMRKAWGRIPPRRRGRYRRMGRKIESFLLTSSRSQRPAFAVLHNDISGAIRLNLQGREPNGRLQPGAECERYCERITRDLLEIKNAETSEPLISDVVRTSESYPGNHAADYADLFVVWNRSGPITTVESPKIGRITRPFVGNRTGDHTAHGLFMFSGPGVPPGPRQEALSVLDLAPTVTACLGIDLPDVQGTPLRELASVSVAN